MKITVHLTRLDLIAFTWAMLFRLRLNQFCMAFMWLIVFWMIVSEAESHSMGDIGAAAFAAAIGAVIGMLVNMAVYVIYLLVATGKTKGLLGRHDITLTPTEFREATEVNDSRYRWVAVPRIFKLRNSLIVQVTYYSGCPIPRRAFDSEQDYQAFCAYAEDAWRKARLAPGADDDAGRAEQESRG